MLSFETCQKLKDDGFPQGTPNAHFSPMEGDSIQCDGMNWQFRQGEWILIPRLEDLIRDIKNDEEIRRLTIEAEFCVDDPGWDYRVSADFGANNPREDVSAYSLISIEEALANLWIALHPLNLT